MDSETNNQAINYGGFWIRTLAAVIDSVLLLLLLSPLVMMFGGMEFLMDPAVGSSFLGVMINYVIPAAVVLIFWFFKSATPGKMVLHLKIVDAKTGNQPEKWQLIVRYLGYYVAMLPLFLGFFWVAFDSKKQGWHDKLAQTVVVKE